MYFSCNQGEIRAERRWNVKFLAIKYLLDFYKEWANWQLSSSLLANFETWSPCRLSAQLDELLHIPTDFSTAIWGHTLLLKLLYL